MPLQQVMAANRLFLYAMLLAASYTVTRTVGDSLFLSRIGSDSLAAVFVASGVSTAALASIWYALTRRWSIGTSVRVSGYVSAALTTAAWFALAYLPQSWWLLAAIYLLTELKGCVYSINIVSATNEILGGHSSRRAWVRVGLGTPLAGVIIGATISLEANFIDMRTWILLSAVIDLLALLPLLNPHKLVVPKQEDGVEPTPAASALAVATVRRQHYACARRFRFCVGVLIAAKVVVLTFVTFYWKASVNGYFDGNERSIARYFGIFYASVGILTLLVQGFVTRHMLSRRSLNVPILVMPVAMSILCTGIAFGSGAFFLLVAVTLAKSLEIWRRSVHDTALGLLYTSIERKKRRVAISINAAVVKPIAEVGASLALLLCSAFWLKSAVFLALGIWFVASISLLRLVTRDEDRPRPGRERSCNELGVKQLASGLFDDQ